MNNIFSNLTNQNPPPRFHLGRIWHKKGKFTRAIKYYQETIETQPDYLPAYLELGSLLLQKEEMELAISIYRQAVSLPSEDNYCSKILEFLTRTKTSNNFQHILLYTDRAEVYGAEQINHALMCGFKKAGKKVTCLQPENNNYLLTARKAIAIDHHWLEKDNIYGYQKDNTRIAIPKALTHTSEATEIFAITKPDLIIFADSCPLSSLVAKEIAISLKIPYISLIHCVKPEWADQFFPLINRLTNTYQKAKAVLAVSNENLDLLRQMFGLPINIGQVMYNGRPNEFFTPRSLESNKRLRKELNIPEKAIVLFTSARLDVEKGYQYQLKAIKNLQQIEIWSQLYFVWAGKGMREERIKQAVTELNAQNQVIFLGECDNVADLLNIADIFILPSEVEGMPLAVMEAMAKGLPIIASSVSGIPEELGDTGKLITNPRINAQATIDELAKTIEIWAKDEQLRQNIGKTCQKRAIKLFSEEKMIENYLTFCFSHSIC